METFLVSYDAEAVLELEMLKGRDERKALFNVVDKLQKLGPRLAPPHTKALKGEGALMELRPRQGRSQCRAIYRRFGEDFVILAIATEADKADFDASVGRARERAKRYADN